ncbi:MAG: hypothetical protein Q6373_024795, partial [Candidatus Sigynarchaeota archaeon]
IVITAVLLKLATPYLRVRAEDKKIAKIKTMQGKSRVPSTPAASSQAIESVFHPIDASQLKPTDGFVLMHMSPPEVIDLDLSRRREKRTKVELDGHTLEDQKNEALAKAVEFDDNGAVEKAIAEYKKASVLARQLGRDDEATSFENRIKQLKQEKEGSP